jgi:hypothetical protein
MTLAFFAIAFFAVGFEIRRWWTVAMPVVLGALYLIVSTAPGSPLFGDTPIPFLVILATAATVVGIKTGRLRVQSLS